MIKPTVGRVVWFWPRVESISREFNFNAGLNQPCAAMVVAVWGDRCVNLSVLDHAGVHHAFGSVPLRQEGDDAPVCDYCEWMPYQIGQAKKEATT
jgi:hypothetical protein